MKVIYILSNGHSGSTVLGSVLANNENRFHIGEFINFYKVCSGKLETCSCGKLPAECEFWSPVIHSFKSHLKTLNLTFEDYEIIRNNAESSLKKTGKADKDINSYITLTHKLFEIIGEVSGKNIIIDSSKVPVRALLLSRTFKNNFSVVYLRRNLFDVVKSYQRKRGEFPLKPFLKASLKSHFKSLYVISAIKKKSYGFNYEDIFEQDKLNRITQKLGYSTAINVKDTFKNEHVIAGNRLRFKKEFKLEAAIPGDYNFKFTDKLLIHLTNKLIG
jgi:hypothetical protein